MKLSDFKYNLPEKLIAQYPSDVRDKSRLMLLNREDGSTTEGVFDDVLNYMEKGDTLVLNETKVFPARLEGTKDKTDAKVEVFLLRELEKGLWEVLVKPARKVRVGNRLSIGNKISCDVIDNTVSGGRVVRFNDIDNFYELVDEMGKSPLPPYIKREPEPMDKERYQTVYARVRGAVAAPTAGLHFTDALLEQIQAKGVKVAKIVLHLGLGSFRPVVVEDLGRHKMDSEYYEISQETSDMVNETKRDKKNVIAVGTSVVRGLETSVTSEGWSKPSSGWTDKFIYPPYDFKIADRLITNFHLPNSTLLMLVSAFAERDMVFKAYRKAIRDKFHFYSYGDSMLVI